MSLNLFYDEFNLVRSKTRMNNINDIHFQKSKPTSLTNDIYPAKLIIENIHVDVHHTA